MHPLNVMMYIYRKFIEGPINGVLKLGHQFRTDKLRLFISYLSGKLKNRKHLHTLEFIKRKSASQWYG